jgi:chromate transporter
LIPARKLFPIYLRIGATSYGGPLGGMASFQQEFVERLKWISPERYAEILTLCKIIPGPAATAMGIQIGRDLGGWRGGLVGGIGFILPAFLMVLALLGGLSQLDMHSPAVAAFLAGARDATWVLIALALPVLVRHAHWERFTVSLALIAAAVVYNSPSLEAWVLLAAGLLSVFRSRMNSDAGARESASLALATATLSPESIPTPTAGVATVLSAGAASGFASVLQIFGVCFKAGAFTFGTGLAVLPVLQGEFVERLGWISSADFMNAVAVGQLTPGPILITATAVGFQKAGIPGAFAATIGAFLPAFLYILLVVPRIWDRLKDRSATRAFLDGALPAVVGAMAAMTFKLLPFSLTGSLPAGEHALVRSLTCMALTALLTVRLKAPPWIVIPVAGLVSGLLFKV